MTARAGAGTQAPPAVGAREEHHGNGAAPALARLDLRGIVKRWPGTGPVLEGVDLALAPGAAVAICGRNGAGKTTLLRIACGMITADEGSVRVDGLEPERDGSAFYRSVGLVSAGNTGLYGRLKAEHHLDMWARLALIPARDRRRLIDRAVSAFDLTPLCGKRVDRLSMGQRQRLRLALGFLHEPGVVLLDEPTTSLDDQGIALLGDALAAHKQSGGAALVCLPSAWRDVPGVDRAYALTRGELEAA